jgi:hypothetical protein
LENLLQPRFHSGMGDEEFEQELTAWEADVAAYERLVNKTFDRDAMIALVISRAPIELQRFLRVTSVQFEGNYEALRAMVRNYTRCGLLLKRLPGVTSSKDTPLALTDAPMEVDFISKGGKGKGKGGRAYVVCHRCGGKGHFARDCATAPDAGGKGDKSGKKGAKSSEQGKGAAAAKGTCYLCGRTGHWARECWSKGKGKSSPKGKGDALATVHEVQVEESPEIDELWVMAVENERMKPRLKRGGRLNREMWFVLDSGSMINAMPVDVLRLFGITPTWRKQLKVRGAGGGFLPYFGQIRLRVRLGKIVFVLLFEVVAVRRPIISASILSECGAEITFSSQSRVVCKTDGGEVRAIDVEQKEGIYGLCGEIIGVEAEDAKTSHQRTFVAYMMPVEANCDLDVSEPLGETTLVAEPTHTIASPNLPGVVEQEHHQYTHLPHQPWCDICIKTRARDDPHPHRAKSLPGVPLDGPPVIQVDHTFMESVTVLSMYSVDFQCGAATAVPSKGMHDFTVAWLVRRIAALGFVDVRLRSDPDVSVKALVAAVQKSRHAVTLVEEGPVKSSQSIGGVERFHRLLQEECRVVRTQLEKDLGCVIDPNAHIGTWIIRHASWLLLSILKIGTQANAADMLTKPVGQEILRRCLDQLACWLKDIAENSS